MNPSNSNGDVELREKRPVKDRESLRRLINGMTNGTNVKSIMAVVDSYVQTVSGSGLNPDWNKPSTVEGINLNELPLSTSNQKPITPPTPEEVLRENILTLSGCNGPYDSPHRCSALHCNHCGLCDVSEEIMQLI